MVANPVFLIFFILTGILARESTVSTGFRDDVFWENLPGVDGKLHSLKDLGDKEIVVVAITCNHCPIAIEYFDRLKEFVSEVAGPESDVALVAISVSDKESDKLEPMAEFAERQGFNFPYLYDESQKVGKQLGATVTPQFFVLNSERKIVFKGPWDDNVNPTKVANSYVRSVVAAIRDGNEPKWSEVRSTGCAIQYKDP